MVPTEFNQNIKKILDRKLSETMTLKKEEVSRSLFYETYMSPADIDILASRNNLHVNAAVKDLRTIKLWNKNIVQSLGVLAIGSLLFTAGNPFAIASAGVAVSGVFLARFLLNRKFLESSVGSSILKQFPAFRRYIKQRQNLTLEVAKNLIYANDNDKLRDYLIEWKTHSNRGISKLFTFPDVWEYIFADLSILGVEGQRTIYAIVDTNLIPEKVERKFPKYIRKFNLAPRDFYHNS